MAFTFDDTVKVSANAPAELRPNQLASVINIFQPQDRAGQFQAKFPAGIVYLVEFEDGNALCIHETYLGPGKFPREEIASNGHLS